jgi:hypothetical protein
MFQNLYKTLIDLSEADPRGLLLGLIAGLYARAISATLFKRIDSFKASIIFFVFVKHELWKYPYPVPTKAKSKWNKIAGEFAGSLSWKLLASPALLCFLTQEILDTLNTGNQTKTFHIDFMN